MCEASNADTLLPRLGDLGSNLLDCTAEVAADCGSDLREVVDVLPRV